MTGNAAWAGILTPADQRGFTPLFWAHAPPYGEVKLDLSARLDIGIPDRDEGSRA